MPSFSAENEKTTVVDREGIPHDWLREKITVEEAERRHPGLPHDERARRFPEIRKPFGFLSAQWEELKAKMQPGDELWEFRSPPESWKHLAGAGGVAVLRDGKVIASLFTIMN